MHILIFLLYFKNSDGTDDKDEDTKDAVEGNVSSSVHSCSWPVHLSYFCLFFAFVIFKTKLQPINPY